MYHTFWRPRDAKKKVVKKYAFVFSPASMILLNLLPWCQQVTNDNDFNI